MKDEAYDKTYHFEESHWWFRARNRIIVDIARRYAGGAGLQILDYGCGTGRMLQELAPLGEVWGCDVSDRALDYCRGRGLSKLIKPDPGLENLGSYDLITLLDVLEHVDDDAGLLRTLGMHLKPGGKMIIAVPAFSWLWSGEDYVSDHKRRYVKRELAAAVSVAGLRTVKLSYFNFFLLPPIFLSIKMKAILNPESMKHSDLAEVPKPLNSLLCGLFRLESPLLKIMNLPVGASLLCVAEKSGPD